ncbi:hypothetical protein LY76DRAFT_606989 [Colletotrichum caudatum]|nr:hypothetical protein LY76DRAFT_606989 [Colletotrichum caudatum]
MYGRLPGPLIFGKLESLALSPVGSSNISEPDPYVRTGRPSARSVLSIRRQEARDVEPRHWKWLQKLVIHIRNQSPRIWNIGQHGTLSQWAKAVEVTESESLLRIVRFRCHVNLYAMFHTSRELSLVGHLRMTRHLVERSCWPSIAREPQRHKPQTRMTKQW